MCEALHKTLRRLTTTGQECIAVLTVVRVACLGGGEGLLRVTHTHTRGRGSRFRQEMYCIPSVLWVCLGSGSSYGTQVVRTDQRVFVSSREKL